MKKTEHDKIVKTIRAKHSAEIKELTRLVEGLAADRDYLRNELSGCREALRETTEELAAA